MSLLRTTSVALLSAALAIAASAAPRLFGVNPFNNGTEMTPQVSKALTLADYGFYEFSPTTGAVIATRIITVPARTITGAVALTRDPTSGIAYAIVKASGVANGRLLISINLDTAVGAEIGNLGDNFSSLAFRSDGQLFGVTGDGATVPETLYLINKTNATKTLATALGNGADGEVIAYNPNDNALYHFSGGTVTFEKVLATSPYTVTPIVSLSGVGEVFGAVWDPARNAFLVSDIASKLFVVSTAGVVSSAVTTFPTDIRGLVLVPDAVVAAPPTVVPTLGSTALIALLLSVAGIGVGVTRSRLTQRRG